MKSSILPLSCGKNDDNRKHETAGVHHFLANWGVHTGQYSVFCTLSSQN